MWFDDSRTNSALLTLLAGLSANLFMSAAAGLVFFRRRSPSLLFPPGFHPAVHHLLPPSVFAIRISSVATSPSPLYHCCLHHELVQVHVRFPVPSPTTVGARALLKSCSLASVAGTQEPVYGPEAFHPVTSQTETVPYTVLSKEDLKWRAMEHTCVETQTFYFTTEAGEQGWIQIIYSNVV